MYIRILCVGKIKEEFFRKRLQELQKEMGKKHKCVITEVEDEQTKENMSAVEMRKVLDMEGNRLLQQLGPRHPRQLVVALCIQGKEYTTREWKRYIEREIENKEIEETVYIIGGSLGLSDHVVKQAQVKLSCSRFTFPHQLMRVMLLEQLLICDTVDDE